MTFYIWVRGIYQIVHNNKMFSNSVKPLMKSLCAIFLFFLAMSTPVLADDISTCLQDKENTRVCMLDYFHEAFKKHSYIQAGNWLGREAVKTYLASNSSIGDEILHRLVCYSEEGYQGESKLSKSLKSKYRNSIISTIEQLLTLDASFDSMPYSAIVTSLFCVVNRQDSELLDFVLTRIKAGEKELDACLYEGYDLQHIPLFRTIQNNDPASTRVLLKHGASPDVTLAQVGGAGHPDENITPLLLALKLDNTDIVNQLIDAGASHITLP